MAIRRAHRQQQDVENGSHKYNRGDTRFEGCVHSAISFPLADIYAAIL